MAKTINAVFTSGVFTRTAKVFQWDNGDKLSFVNVDLPNNYQVHFANSLTGESKSVLGDSTGVEIPPEYFVPGSEIYAWVWVSTENGGYTKYQVTIPVYRRAQPQNVTPTPAQQTIIDQAIEALNQALETQITPEEKAKLAGIEAGAQVNDIEHIYATDPSTEEEFELPIGGLFAPAKSVKIPDYLEIKALDFTIDSNGDVTSGPLWNDIDSAFDAGRKVLLAKVTDSDGNIHTLPFTKFFEAPNVPPSYTFAGCGDDGKIRVIQEGSYANAWVYTEFDFDGLIVAEIDAVFDNTGNRADLLTTDKSDLVSAINEVNAKAGGGGVEDFAVTLDLNTYAVTPGTGVTISAIRAAIADGKIVRLIANSSYVFDLVNDDSLDLYFSCPMTDGISQIRAYQNLDTTDAWAFSGSVIPTKTSDLTNDSNFATTSQVDTVVRSEQRTTDYRDQLVVSRNGNNYYFPLGVSYFFFVYDLAQERFTNVPPTEVVDYALQAGVPMIATLDLVSGATHHYHQLTFCKSGGCSFTYQDDVAVYVVWLNDDNWEFVEGEPEWVVADAGKVDKETGKGLSTNDYTTAEKNKLAGIASGAQVNVIETVKRNGTALAVTNKAVDISVPTKTSDLTNDSGFLTSYTETDPTVSSWAKASSKPSYTASEVGAIAAPSSPASGAFLVYNGSAWTAQTLATWQGGNY